MTTRTLKGTPISHAIAYLPMPPATAICSPCPRLEILTRPGLRAANVGTH